MMLYFNVFLSFFWIWAPAPATLLVVEQCSPVALEEEPYTVQYSNDNSRGTYFWYYTSGLKSSQKEVKINPCSEDSLSMSNDRISASLFENYSDSQTYARTRIMFNPVNADERDAVLRCINVFNFAPFKSEVFSCRMQVHAKPQSTHCTVDEHPASNLSLRCSAHQLFPDVVCTVDLIDTRLKSKAKNPVITYTSIPYNRGDSEYKNASCFAEFQHLPPGNYLANVSVNVQSVGPARNMLVTQGYFKRLNFTIPKYTVTLTQKNIYRCLEHNQSTLAVHLRCDAEGYTSKPLVDWYWNGGKVIVANKRIETGWLKGKVSSTFKFTPVPGDKGAVINCTVLSDTKVDSAIFKIPDFPDIHPEFINASNGQLIINPGIVDITCRIPGNGSGFVKLNITCSANNKNLVRQVSPGSLGHLTIKDALVLDQALCRCSAVHSFYCYNLTADVLVRVKTYTNTTDADTPPEHTTTVQASKNKMVYVFITCSVILCLILVVLFFLACKWLKKRLGQSQSQQHHDTQAEHIYHEPDENVSPGSYHTLDPNVTVNSPMLEPPLRTTNTEHDSLDNSISNPQAKLSILPDIVSEFSNERFSMQRKQNSVSRDLSDSSDDSYTCLSDTAVMKPLLESIYINLVDRGRHPKGLPKMSKNGTKNYKIRAPTTTSGLGSCVHDKSTVQDNEQYISPLDSDSSSTTSLPTDPNTLPNHTMEIYTSLIDSSNFGISEIQPNSLQLENPKSHKFHSKPKEKQVVKKKSTNQRDTFKDSRSLCWMNDSLNDSSHNRKHKRGHVSEVESRKMLTRDSNYMELHPIRIHQCIGQHKDKRCPLSLSTAGDQVTQ